MSENQLENQNQNKLPKESWTNAPQPQSISSKITFLHQFIADVAAAEGSDELNFQSGDSIKLTFFIDDPETGMRTKSMPKWDKAGNMIKDSEGKIVKEDQQKPNLVVFNHRDGLKQNWWISTRWAGLAAHTMEKFNTDTLQVERVGKKQDTIYTFMPLSFERLGV